MYKSRLQKRLEAGEAVAGVFAPAGVEDYATAGILRWSASEGAELELIERSHPWPGFGDAFVVHGSPYEGEDVTLLETMVRTQALDEHTTRLTAPRIALGAHTDLDEKWPRASYRPGSLHEWIIDTGLTHSRSRKGTPRFSITWKQPTAETATVQGADIAIAPSVETAWVHGPRREIETAMTFEVTANEPLTVDEHMANFGHPLLGFSTFAADQPDDFAYEAYARPGDKRRIVMLGRDRVPLVRDWDPIEGRMLFMAHDLDETAGPLRRWLELWRRTAPSLALFQQTIEEGNVYSAPRFLTLYTAAEGYWRKSAKGMKWSPAALARWADVDEKLTGVTKDAIALLGASRAYHAHLVRPRNHAEEEIVEQTYESTRRLHALMQACLLREIGLGTADVERLLKQHYRSWPVP